MRTRISSLALAVVLVSPATVSSQPPVESRVVLVTLDGARWQEVFGGMDESLLRATSAKDADVTAMPVYKKFRGTTASDRRERLMPFLWTTFVTQHGFIAGDRTAGSMVSVTNRHWFSYPGYSEMLTGQAHDEVITSNDPIRNQFPSVFQFVQRRLLLPPAQIATFASWGVFNEIVESEQGATTVNAGMKSYDSPSPQIQALSALQHETPTPWGNTRRDAYTFRFAMDYLKRVHPRVLYIAFDETDDWAHEGHYDLVLEMLHRTDAYLKELWDTLQADSAYRGKTTVIVTTDHGRGRTTGDWRKHGKDVPGADELWMAIASPGSSRRGQWRDHPPLFQNQLAATIAAAFGLIYSEQNPQAGPAIALKDEKTNR
jgi:hypothetical protein